MAPTRIRMVAIALSIAFGSVKRRLDARFSDRPGCGRHDRFF